VPHVFLAAPPTRGSAFVALKRTSPNRRANGGAIVRVLKPVNPAQFLSGVKIERPRQSISSRHVLEQPTPGLPVHAFNAPRRFAPGLFRPLSCAPKSLRRKGRQTLHPQPNPAAEWSFWNPFGSDRRGTQTHSRRTERKLGRLRYARQGLVRLSESNTKYGGQNGKTGVSTAPVIGPSISESTRIRKGKKCRPPCGFWLRPDLHRGSIFLAQKCCVSETHITAWAGLAAMPGGEWSRAGGRVK
jgi:hypothetical protein